MNRTVGHAIISAALVLAAGCAAPDDGANRSSAPATVESPPATNPTHPPPGEVVGTSSSSATLLSSVPRTADLWDHERLSGVVEGVITIVDDTVGDEMIPTTRFTVEVERSLGDDIGSTVTVVEIGGYQPVGDVPLAERAKMGLDEYLPSDAVIDHAPLGGAPHPGVGDRVLMFLTTIPTGETDQYVGLGEAFGRFVPDGSGGWTRAAWERGYERALSGEDVDSRLRDVDTSGRS